MRLRLLLVAILVFSIAAASYPVIYSIYAGQNSGTVCAPLLPCQQPARASVTCSTFCIVIIKNSSYYPASINVTVGATVEWVNMDSVPHTSTSFSLEGWSSPFIAPGRSYTFTFSGLRPGTYYYHCEIHPFMEGTIYLTNG